MMKQRLSILVIATIIISALSSDAFAAVGRDPYTYFFHDTFGDFSEELARAKDEGKEGILVFFELDECPFCHRMKQTVLNQPEVQEYFRKHFLNFAVDIEGDVEITDFRGNARTQKEWSTKVNRVRATPVFAIYNLEGKQVVRYTGATTGIEEFMWLGEYYV
ncbi:MAG: thioredoxin fold domain-containing protein, partial [Gammaproteobacteria bacterium]